MLVLLSSFSSSQICRRLFRPVMVAGPIPGIIYFLSHFFNEEIECIALVRVAFWNNV